MISSSVVQPLLTDQYQITMAYAYWKSGKTEDRASFHLFFRKCPFKGEFTIFAGLSECLHFLERFEFSYSDIEYLKSTFPQCEEDFFKFLKSQTPKVIKVEAISEGSVCFPRVPLMKVSGPLIMVQLLETELCCRWHGSSSLLLMERLLLLHLKTELSLLDPLLRPLL